MLTIYLAGGFKSGWQEIVKKELGGKYLFHDPSQHGIPDPCEYTAWDLKLIRDSDIVLANMESDNPGGYALSLEIGYASAYNKPIFLVDDPGRKHFDMTRQCADEVFPNLDSIMKYMKEFEHEVFLLRFQ